MEFQLASKNDFLRLQAFYWDIIEKMSSTPYLPAWKKEIHPSNDFLLQSLEERQVYMLTESEKICAALVLNTSAHEDYKKISWSLSCSEEEVFIVHILAVAPSMQGKGIGKAIMERVIALARTSGKKAIRLDTSDTNDPANHLYKSLGFAYIETKRIFCEGIGFFDFNMYELVL